MSDKTKNWRDRVIRYIRELIFGFEDSLVSTLGAITGIAGGSQDSSIVILAGMVIIFVESISMGAGTYLSSKSEREVVEETIRREKQTVKHDIEGEKQEIREYLEARRFKSEEIEPIVERLASDRGLLLEEMLLHEHNIIQEPRARSVKRGLVMWGSYFVGGFFPVLPYLFLSVRSAFLPSILATLIVLFLLGAFKTKFTGKSWYKSGFEMAVISLSAAGVGYVVGRIVAMSFGI
ncbi:VIT1/CCC1 transporter family protein [Patescibacteria group bacterium]|nr:VIT1/CCC1 transporter family protein [Patescibacteria group bacterium]MBU1922387.1 VIT1/CCC1 transporter family protein [Patescibacteria group bacterium]